MSFLPDELKIQPFQCPNCNQYINSEASVCRFCSTIINEEIKESGLKKEKIKKIEFSIGWHKKLIVTGTFLFIIGLFLIISPIIEFNYSNNVNFNCLAPLFLVGGIAMTVVNIIGYFKEKRKLKNV